MTRLKKNYTWLWAVYIYMPSDNPLALARPQQSESPVKKQLRQSCDCYRCYLDNRWIPRDRSRTIHSKHLQHFSPVAVKPQHKRKQIVEWYKYWVCSYDKLLIMACPFAIPMTANGGGWLVIFRHVSAQRGRIRIFWDIYKCLGVVAFIHARIVTQNVPGNQTVRAIE